MAEPTPAPAPAAPASAGGRSSKSIQGLLTQKFLGLPGWAWAIGAGAGAGFLYFHFRKPAAPSSASGSAPAPSIQQLGADQTSGIPPGTSTPGISYSGPPATAPAPNYSGLQPGVDFPNYQPSPAGPKGEAPPPGYYIDWSSGHTVPLGFAYAQNKYLPLSQAGVSAGATTGMGGAGTVDYPERLRYLGWVTVAPPQDASVGIGGALRRPARRGALRYSQLPRGGAGGGSTPRTTPRINKLLRRRLIR